VRRRAGGWKEINRVLTLQKIFGSTSSFPLNIPLKGVLDLSKPICCIALKSILLDNTFILMGYTHTKNTFLQNAVLIKYPFILKAEEE